MRLMDRILARLTGHTPPLAPSELWDRELSERIAELAAGLRNGPAEAQAVAAGLYLWNGALDESHRISQELETPLGSYWHGIMHRMEGDYGNANYWFARAGRHPVHAPLQRFTARLLGEREGDWRQGPHVGLRSKLDAMLAAAGWTPPLFTAAVELCVHNGEQSVRPLLEAIQLEELRLLLEYSDERSGGGKGFEAE